MSITVRLIEYTREGERLVAAAAKQTIKRRPVTPEELDEEEVEVWIRETFRRQHWSPWEFSSYTFLVDGCSRVCSHQLVRHRHASYAQMSQRYSEGHLVSLALEACRRLERDCPKKPKTRADHESYAKILDDYAKKREESLVEVASMAFVIPPHIPARVKAELAYQYLRSAAAYFHLLAQGVAREDARFLLPQAVKTTIYVKMNARELATVFLPLRMCTKAQWEIRSLAWRIWRELVRVHPRLFRYVGPRCVIAENTVRDKPIALEDYLKDKREFTIPRCPELVPRKGIPGCLKYASKS